MAADNLFALQHCYQETWPS